MKKSALVALPVLVAAGALLAARAEADTTRSFESRYWGVSFRYPAEWRTGAWRCCSTKTSVVVYLSTDPLRDPCRRTDYSEVCGNPVGRLRRSGVLVTVLKAGYPGATLAGVRGKPERIAGRPAKVWTGKPRAGLCRSAGGDEELTATIGRSSNFLIVRGCLRKPGLEASKRRIRSLLDSLRLARRP